MNLIKLITLILLCNSGSINNLIRCIKRNKLLRFFFEKHHLQLTQCVIALRIQSKHVEDSCFDPLQ